MSDHHKFGTHLPRSGKEFLLFVLVISLISVNTIPVLITGVNNGFSLDSWLSVLRVLPVLWVVVVATVMLTRKPAEWLKNQVVRPVARLVMRGHHRRIDVRVRPAVAQPA